MGTNNKDVFIIADNVYSPIGITTQQNFEQVKNGVSGVQKHDRPDLSDVSISASIFNKDQVFISGEHNYTKFEQLLIASVTDALSYTDIKIDDPKTGLIISSTKGNISLLETEENNETLQKRISLNTSAQLIAGHFGFVNQPIIISNACISGVMAIVTGMRMIQSGQYNQVVVTGADVISKFVVSGFQSFQALSSERCKPFDKNRTGLNLGEGAATVILSGDEKYKGNIRVTGGGISNDANHISGPSRTGQELGGAIIKAINNAGVKAEDIGLVSAHGTATPYNDEMEAKAITLAGLQNAPVNGLKAFYGHTLGAAGLIETVLAKQCMEQNTLLPTLGFKETGTAPLNITTAVNHVEIKHGVKTASGFGGCNGALVLSK
ncbi:beta-ketoacyl-[acyl-carrier-protein] synthase family protein [Mucilaginibacter jinjuensis]|uniref:Beta-ketoacyl synthase N-terminal-like domain-containing protein n=1 Tax=Mucilaginibacter jinjuensis TaxID=1176721 RepID=A0ABY7T7T6_9SPHI|nr:beta-ketoacyl synthase N-terminal-like domain-containing protein [Mucilaginibacter jinjuensis]WCT12190.1 beta-ketoacyl synthase N-terminal-like domain-containing protein [Mucilaginibacter jinjuensis]